MWMYEADSYFEEMNIECFLGIMAELTTGQALFGTRYSISTIFF